MMLRRVVFWLHLLTGLTAGTVILVMAATGVLLAFEPQLVDLAERSLRTVPPPASNASRVSLTTLVAAAQDARGGERASTIVLRSEPQATVRVGFGRDATLFMHPFTGAVLGPGSRTHDVLHVVEDWHRWLGSRDLGRPSHRSLQPRVPRARDQRAVSLVAPGVESPGGAGRHRARPAAARQGARFQLAQQHRLLVRAVHHRHHAHGQRHVVSVGERPPLSTDRQHATAGRRRGGRWGGARQSAGGPRAECRRRAGDRPRCAGDARGRPGSRLGGHHLAAAAAPRGARDGVHPGVAQLASESALGAHARRRHGPGRCAGSPSRAPTSGASCARSCASCTPARSAA